MNPIQTPAGQPAGRHPLLSTSLSRRQIAIVLALILLSFIPGLLLTLAPLSDWPTHIAIASELHWLMQGNANPNYHLDFSFLGYSLLHLLLAALMNFFGWEIAAKLTIILLLLLGPVCWWAFFRIMAPEKESWLLIGSLMNYSIFFYFGTINYLFAVHLGTVWFAIGLDAICHGRQRPWAFLTFGLLTFLSQGYAFFLLAAVLGMAWLWHAFKTKRPSVLLTMALLALLLGMAGFTTISSPGMIRDTSYQTQVQVCTIQAASAPFNSKEVMSALFEQVFFRLYPSIFDSLLPSPILFVFLLLPIFGGILVANLLVRRPAGATEIEPAFIKFVSSIRIDPLFLGLGAVLVLHMLLFPYCVEGMYCMLNLRSLPFALACFALALRSEALSRHAWKGLALLLAINILYQGVIFSQAAGGQAQILAFLQSSAQALPDHATAFVVPSEWNAPTDTSRLPLGPHYHALLLVYNPRIYVSGLFLAQDTFILRSSFPYYDEMVNDGPYQMNNGLSAPVDSRSCYGNPPAAYGWVLGPQLVMRPNPNNISAAAAAGAG